jgi:rod shape-determining protein MreC
MKVIVWLAVVTAVSLFSILLSNLRALDSLNSVSLTLMAPIEAEMHDIAEPVDEFVQGVTDRGDLVRENERLREENAALLAQIAAQQDAQLRVEELEEALGVKEGRPEDQLLAANVIAQDPSPLKRMIAIDRGISDGIDEGMVVLSGQGTLVGTVSRAYENFAWIRLVTDPDSSVNSHVNVAGTQPDTGPPEVLTPETPPPGATPTPAPSASATPPPPAEPADTALVRGVAEGDIRQGIVLDLLPSEIPIAEDSLVVTSGLGGNYPRGILLGSISSVQQRPQSALKTAVVEPTTDLSSLDTVLVLTSFEPARLDEQ